MSDLTTIPALRAAIERALAALSGAWRSASDGRIMLVFGPKAARAGVLRELNHRPLDGVVVAALSTDGPFMALSALAVQAGVTLHPYDERAGLRALAAAYATAGKRLVLVCNDVERAPRHDLAYICRGVNTTVNDAYDGKPGILLILMGAAGGAAHRQIASAWPDAEMGTQSHYLG